MSLNVGQTNCDGNPVNRQWIMLEIPDLTARSIPLLATVNDDAILILGGKRDVEILSDGMLFNPNTMEMISFLTQSSPRFWCAFNQHYMNDEGHVCALVIDDAKPKSNLLVIEVPQNGEKVKWQCNLVDHYTF